MENAAARNKVIGLGATPTAKYMMNPATTADKTPPINGRIHCFILPGTTDSFTFDSFYKFHYG